MPQVHAGVTTGVGVAIAVRWVSASAMPKPAVLDRCLILSMEVNPPGETVALWSDGVTAVHRFWQRQSGAKYRAMRFPSPLEGLKITIGLNRLDHLGALCDEHHGFFWGVTRWMPLSGGAMS